MGNHRHQRGRNSTESGDSAGYVSGSDSPDGAGGGGIEDLVLPTALLVLLRIEIEAAASDARELYLRGPQSCRPFPIRILDLWGRLMEYVEKDHDASNGEGRPSSMAKRLINALFSRGQILTASGFPIGVIAERAPRLQKSRSIVAPWMSQRVNFFGEFARGGITQTDRHVRLCLTMDGPEILHKGERGPVSV